MNDRVLKYSDTSDHKWEYIKTVYWRRDNVIITSFYQIITGDLNKYIRLFQLELPVTGTLYIRFPSLWLFRMQNIRECCVYIFLFLLLSTTSRITPPVHFPLSLLVSQPCAPPPHFRRLPVTKGDTKKERRKKERKKETENIKNYLQNIKSFF